LDGKRGLSVEVASLAIEVNYLSVEVASLSIEVNYLSVEVASLAIEVNYLSVEVASLSIEVNYLNRSDKMEDEGFLLPAPPTALRIRLT
jgi:hypothetical protein